MLSAMQLSLFLVGLLVLGCQTACPPPPFQPPNRCVPPPPFAPPRLVAPQPPEDVLTNPIIRPGFQLQCGEFWSGWSQWSACSATCGCGVQTRTRKCLKVAQPCIYGRGPVPNAPVIITNDAPSKIANASAAPAPAAPVPPIYWDPPGCKPNVKLQTRLCNLQPCCEDKDGAWGQWGCWSHCRAGVRRRRKVCDWPIPQGRGRDCPGRPFEDECCEGYLDIVFLVDGSGSIGSSNFQQINKAVNNAILSAGVDDGFVQDRYRAGIATYGASASAVRPLNSFAPFVPESWNYPGGLTDTRAALIYANYQMFKASQGDRPNPPNPNVLVIITDGISQTNYADINLSNVDRVIAIGVGTNVSPQLQAIATDLFTDYFRVLSACNIEYILRRKLLCQDGFPSPRCARFGPIGINASSGP